MNIKYRLILVLAFAFVSNIYSYNFQKIPAYLINFANLKNIHENILHKAQKSNIRQRNFAGFYIANVNAQMKVLHLSYLTALRDIENNSHKALEKYEELIKLYPNKPQNHFFEGLVLERLNLNRRASDSYIKAAELDIDGYDGIVYEKLGFLNSKLGFYEDAVIHLNKSLQIIDGNVPVILELADLYFELGYFKKSAETMDGFFYFAGNSKTAKEQSVGFKCEALAYHGYKVNGCVSFENYYREFLSNVNPPLEIQTAELETEISQKALKENITKPPDLARVYNEFAFSETMLKSGYPLIQLKKAAALKTKQIELFPTYKSYAQRAFLNYRLAQIRVNNFMSCEKDLLKAAKLAKDTGKTPYYVLLTDIYAKYGLYDKAFSLLKKALKNDKTNPYLYRIRAYLNIKRSKYKKAYDDITVYFTLEKNRDLAADASKGYVCKMLELNYRHHKKCKNKEYFYRNLFVLPMPSVIGDPAFNMEFI
jgi:tetratricopeptide (TPR) repeat protein